MFLAGAVLLRADLLTHDASTAVVVSAVAVVAVTPLPRKGRRRIISLSLSLGFASNGITAWHDMYSYAKE